MNLHLSAGRPVRPLTAIPRRTQDALCTEFALLPARNLMAKLDLVADLLKASALVRAALLLAFLLSKLLALRARQSLPRLFRPCSRRGVGSAVYMARASLRSIVVRDIAGLEGKEEPAGEVQLRIRVDEKEPICRGGNSYSGLIGAVPGGNIADVAIPQGSSSVSGGLDMFEKMGRGGSGLPDLATTSCRLD